MHGTLHLHDLGRVRKSAAALMHKIDLGESLENDSATALTVLACMRLSISSAPSVKPSALACLIASASTAARAA
jgi:hypothetical protein